MDPTPNLKINFFLFLLLLLGLNDSILMVEATELQCFESRPDLCAPILAVTQYDAGVVTPGHIFISPANVSAGKSGPYIYTNSGELLWHGANITHKDVNNFHPCRIAAEEKLCMLELQHGRGVTASGPVLAIGEDLDMSREAGLTEIKGGQAFDMHELNSVDNGSAVLTTHYMPRIWDLSSIGGPSVGYIKTSGFQEIDVKNGAVNFEWDALEHIDLAESHMKMAPSTWGDGLSPESSWDYFHINSVDKDSRGDYYISGRHTSTIVKISGRNGTVLWRLGGNRSDFTFEPGLNFSSQHNVRLQAEDEVSVVLSVFNNGYDGFRQTANSSSGLLLRLNMTTMHTTLIQRYPAPGGFLSRKKGSLQILPGGNAFASWGGTLNVSEHTPDGSHTVFQAHVIDESVGAHVYRIWKANFTTSPTTSPDVKAVATSNTGPTVWHVSWNGATEVQGWRVYAAQDPLIEYKLIGSFPKEGFETKLEVGGYFPWAIIEAVNGAHEGIRNTTAPIHTIPPSVDHYDSSFKTWSSRSDQWLMVSIMLVVMGGLVHCVFRRLKGKLRA
ncbi:unnamed protein product [Penicillium salamii]|uniref:ASST-domain-containing protein n=1 Tax=Penicillium salamii TaxID=1612424 RepID=A0A9W4J078_9EURO|nr:unnamed protein product [Penicillium salamii]